MCNVKSRWSFIGKKILVPWPIGKKNAFTKKVPVPDRKLLQKLQNSNPFQHDCLIRHINMCKINCQVRTPKVRKLQSSALYLGRTLQFFHIISAKKDELCSNSKGCASCWVMSWHLASSSHERSSKKLVDCHYTMKALTEQWEFDTLSNVLTSGEHILWTVK